MKHVYFVRSASPNVGSVLLRAVQIKDELQQRYPESYTLKIIHKNDLKNPTIVKNLHPFSIFIWVKFMDISIVKKLKNNVHIFDLVDNYVYEQKGIHNLLSTHPTEIAGIIVNSQFMSTHIQQTTKYCGNIFVIHHHWDVRLSSQTKVLVNSHQLVFGYMGSIASLNHSDNFLHYRYLVKKYPIQLIDTELGTNVTTLVQQNKFHNVKIIHNPQNMQNIVINFNCHLSIRKNNCPLSNFKTTAKLATAAALSHNIITTREKAVLDILPEDYPFLLSDTSLPTICAMMELMMRDYSSGNKVLWNQGIKMMEDAKQKLSITEIGSQYVEMISKLSR